VIGALLPQSFYARDALVVAVDLIGRVLVREDVAMRITEVEAYRWPADTANHSRAGKTARNAPMWGPAGRAYVYVCYGIHPMLNLVTGREGEAEAVLIRSCEPIAGMETILARRNGITGPNQLTGPGKVGRALALDPSWSHHVLFEVGGLEVREGEPAARTVAGPRVGIDYASPEHREAPWRSAEADSRGVSHRKGLA
jgi:DNA-3-methyladenine glycosylase